jgi:branched-chain amino acid transport system ATP-binding protein
MTAPVVRMDGVTKRYGDVTALDGVSLELTENTIHGLLGRNGAGKTTALKAIMRLIDCRAGSIRLGDQDLTRQPPHAVPRLGVGYVPQGRRLFPEMTVEENLRMGLLGGRGKFDVTEIYELFPILKDRLRQVAGTLSGGQQQMVAIGRALMSSPKLLLLDEPFIGVAPMLVEEIIRVLRSIAAAGVTMLLVEQNIHRALDFVERAYVIENGRTVLEGTREALIGNPQFNSKFLGLD